MVVVKPLEQTWKIDRKDDGRVIEKGKLVTSHSTLQQRDREQTDWIKVEGKQFESRDVEFL